MLGNLSENPSPVDLYLYSSDESSPRLVQHDVAYGTILPYQAALPSFSSTRSE